MKRVLLVMMVLLLSLPACGGGVAKKAASPLTGDPVAGEKLFASACAGCHGQEMTQNEFIAAKTDQELVEFIKAGGAPDEPLVMPPKGGNPTLTDEKLYHIAAYLRSLQE